MVLRTLRWTILLGMVVGVSACRFDDLGASQSGVGGASPHPDAGAPGPDERDPMDPCDPTEEPDPMECIAAHHDMCAAGMIPPEECERLIEEVCFPHEPPPDPDPGVCIMEHYAFCADAGLPPEECERLIEDICFPHEPSPGPGPDPMECIAAHHDMCAAGDRKSVV